MSHETFTAWLAERQGKDTTTGDFADDVRRDTQWQEPTSLDGLLSYLTRRGACREAKDAAKRAWRAFEKQRPAKP